VLLLRLLPALLLRNHDKVGAAIAALSPRRRQGSVGGRRDERRRIDHAFGKREIMRLF
jgi:hypothetical protein